MGVLGKIVIIAVILLVVIAIVGYFEVQNLLNTGITVAVNATQVAGVPSSTLNVNHAPDYALLSNSTVFSPP